MEDNHHHSFTEFYGVKNPEALPYNTTPENTKGVGEKSTFIGLPVKHNARTIINGKIAGAKNSFMKLFQAPDLEASLEEAKIDPSIKYYFLNYEKALMPYLVVNSAIQTQKTLKILLEHEEKLKLEDYYVELGDYSKAKRDPDNLILSHFPSDTQWYKINQLRIHAGSPERSFAGIEKLADYYAQLQFLESKFALDTGKVEIGFVWYESWYPEKLVVTSCIQYEKASTLYNLATIYSQMGANERLSSPDGKKRAAANFQKAAGILFFIRDTLCQTFKVKLDSHADLGEGSLSTFATLMLAQAAECFYEKASDDQSTSMLTAIVAIYVADLYHVSMRHRKDSGDTTKKLPKRIVSYMKAKYHMYAAIAQFHTKPNTSLFRVVGERMARLDLALKQITLAIGFAKDSDSLLFELASDYGEKISTAFLCLDSANIDQIHDTPFDARLLTSLRRPLEAMVNPVGMEYFIEKVSNCKDVLEGLISSESHVALQEVLSESRQLAHDGTVKMKSLLEHYRHTLPTLPALPIKEADKKRLSESSISSKKLLVDMHGFLNAQNLLDTSSIISCMKKALEYSKENLKESLDIIGKLANDSEKRSKAKDPALYLKLKSIQANVQEHYSNYEKYNHTVSNYQEKYSTVISKLVVLEWNTENFESLFSGIATKGNLYDNITSRWTKMQQTLEFEKISIAKYCKEIDEVLVELKKLPNYDSWKIEEKIAINEFIQERKQFIVNLDSNCQIISSDLDQAKKNCSLILSQVKPVENLLNDNIKDCDLIDAFKNALNTIDPFREEIQLELQNLLQFRNHSCRVLYMCLELIHDDGKDYINTCPIPRDPHLPALVMHTASVQHHTEVKASVEGLLPLSELKDLLLDCDILPLNNNSEREDNFTGFWNNIHPNVEPKEEPKPIIKERPHISRLTSSRLPSNLQIDFDTGKIMADFGSSRRVARKVSGRPKAEVVRFEQDNETKNHKGVFQNMYSVVLRAFGAKKDDETKNTEKRSSYPFTYSYANETSAESLGISDTSADDACMKRLMKENSRLRSQVSNIRREVQTGRKEKDLGLEANAVTVESKHSRNLDKNVRNWVKCAKGDTFRNESSSNEEFVQYRVVSYPGGSATTTNDPHPVAIYLKEKRRSKHGKKRSSREDSGLTRSKSSSIDFSSSLGMQDSSALTLMKEENERIAKNLGRN